jgi:hypothetical protein
MNIYKHHPTIKAVSATSTVWPVNVSVTFVKISGRWRHIKQNAAGKTYAICGGNLKPYNVYFELSYYKVMHATTMQHLEAVANDIVRLKVLANKPCRLEDISRKCDMILSNIDVFLRNAIS